MKKRILAAILMLLMLSVVSLSSCSVLSELGIGSADTGVSDTFSGKYESITISPKIVVTFNGNKVTVAVGSRSISGTYTVDTDEDGTQQVHFDFADQTLPRCPIRTGTYPISFGTQYDVDYMLVFGTRYNKVS